MAVDRSHGATVLLSILAGLAAALLPMALQTRDWSGLMLVESSVVLSSMLLVLVRQKTIRERCVCCGSDVETHFLATRLPRDAHTMRDRSILRIAQLADGPICRVCTDLPSDCATRYPFFTRFDDRLNPIRKCHRCGRRLRQAMMTQVQGKDKWECLYPQRHRCNKLSCKREEPTQADPRSP